MSRQKGNKIAVYGSLRYGEYNYNAFNSHYKMHHTGTHIVDGLELYSLGAYPACAKGNGKVIVDTFEVTDECFSRIHGMEIGAGYYASTINIDGEPHTIWLMTKGQDAYGWRRLEEEERVESGDWSSYLKEKREQTLTKVKSNL